jgi:hypothetical protein
VRTRVARPAIPRVTTAGALARTLGAGIGFGCGDGADGPRDLPGIYVLRRVGGQAPPAFAADGTRYGTAVYADTLALRADGTLTEVWYMGAGASVTRASGTWRVRGATVRLTHDALPYTVHAYDGPTFTGTLGAGGTLTVAASPVTARPRRGRSGERMVEASTSRVS